MSLVRKYWGADRAYHHTAPINNIYGLHESLRIVLEEGLEARWKRHQEAHDRFSKGARRGAGPGLQVKEGRRLPQLNAVKIPAGVEDSRPQGAAREARHRDRGRARRPGGQVWRIGLRATARVRRSWIRCRRAEALLKK